MGYVVWTAFAFLAFHISLAEQPLRGIGVRLLGERPFVWTYSVLAIVQLLWLGHAVAVAPVDIYWHPPATLRAVSWLLIPIAILLAVCGFTQNNPTATLAPKAVAVRRVVGILAVTRHPVMWSLLLWSAARLLAVDQAAEALRYLTFALLAGWGVLRLDAKQRAKWGEEAWRDFSARTSNLPFAAMASGRARLKWREIGWLRWGAAAALLAAAAFWL